MIISKDSNILGVNMDLQENKLPTREVYHIFNLEYLLNDIDNETMTFSHPSSFDDIMEYKNLDLLFVQSWSSGKDLPAMWEIYSKNKDCIMVKFDPKYFTSKLTDFFPSDDSKDTFKPFPFPSYWKDIKYDLEEFEKEDRDPLERLFHKRSGYNYEHECRWVIDLRNHDWLPSTKNKNGKIEDYPKIIPHYSEGKYRRFIKVPFSKDAWENFIHEIIIDPRANDDYFQYVKELFYHRMDIFIDKKHPIIIRSSFEGKSETIDETHLSSDIIKLSLFSQKKYSKLDTIFESQKEISAHEMKLWLFSRHQVLLQYQNFSAPVNGFTSSLGYQIYNKLFDMQKDKDLTGSIIRVYIISSLLLISLQYISFTNHKIRGLDQEIEDRFDTLQKFYQRTFDENYTFDQEYLKQLKNREIINLLREWNNIFLNKIQPAINKVVPDLSSLGIFQFKDDIVVKINKYIKDFMNKLIS